MTEPREPHPKNVPGDFYVVNGCCTACGVPEETAPDAFGWENNHCFVKRQPQTDSELYQMVNAIAFSELDCIRYRGRDEAFLKRMAENGMSQQVDFPLTYEIGEIHRGHVTFEVSDQHRLTTLGLAYDYRNYLRSRSTTFKFRGPKRSLLTGEAWLQYAWYKDNFHKVRFTKVAAHRNEFCAQTVDGFGSADLHDWLLSNSNYSNIMWYTAEQWKAGEANGARWPR